MTLSNNIINELNDLYPNFKIFKTRKDFSKQVTRVSLILHVSTLLKLIVIRVVRMWVEGNRGWQNVVQLVTKVRVSGGKDGVVRDCTFKVAVSFI